jgi:tripartite-type tricarboxylate transporter receptor subunit TctC
VIVENRAGAGGATGAKSAANAEPDGYTLLLGSTATLAVIPAVTKSAGYDPVKSFTAVAKITDSVQVVVVHPSLPVKSVRDLVAYAKAHPGKLNYASAGHGNLTHLAGELFKARAGIDMVHVPYKSDADSISAILGGQVQLTFASITVVLPFLRDGQLKALAVTGTARATELPDLPTVIEGGVPDYVVTTFFGVVAPAGTSAAIVGKLNAAINAGLAAGDMRANLQKLGAGAPPASPQAFADFIAAEARKWSALANSAGINVD